MLSARITVLVLFVSLIVFQHTGAWRRRRRRRCTPLACVVSSWSSWSSCSATNSCGQRGQQRRSRTITSQPSCGGAACPSLDVTRQCYSSTPVNCQLSSWSQWSACTASSCGARGTQSSSRHRIITEQCGGTCTYTFRKTRSCYSSTPVNCQLSSWSRWSACTASSCGARGTQSSSRHRIITEQCGGTCTSTLRKTRSCYSSTPVNCQLSSWSQWSACTVTSCGARGTQSSSRQRITTEQCGGTCTSIFLKSRRCYSHASVDCQLSSWSEWSACAKTSSSSYTCRGIESSTRHKTMMEKCGGRCTYSFRKTRTCFAEGSSVDCQLGSWSEWSACTLKTCDVSSGVQFITRHKVIEEKCGGTCTSLLRKSRTCLADFTCLNGGSLSGGTCLCAKGFSGICCEKAALSSPGMYSQYSNQFFVEKYQIIWG